GWLAARLWLALLRAARSVGENPGRQAVDALEVLLPLVFQGGAGIPGLPVLAQRCTFLEPFEARYRVAAGSHRALNIDRHNLPHPGFRWEQCEVLIPLAVARMNDPATAVKPHDASVFVKGAEHDRDPPVVE